MRSSSPQPPHRSTPLAPETFEHEGLLLRRPLMDDAPLIYSRYASDDQVTRYLGWPRHTSVEDSRVFVGFSDAEWVKWGAGPYLTFDRAGETLVGSTGLAFDQEGVASTGYVVARDCWGLGHATTMLRAMIQVSRAMGVRRLYALCHVEHEASRRVMEKCGLTPEGVLARHMVFPNLGPWRADVLCYAIAP